MPSSESITPYPITRGIATSFEGKHGSIRYWLKAEIDKPWSFNHKTKKCFTVISPIDINIPEYMVSVSLSLSTYTPPSISTPPITWLVCPVDSVYLALYLPIHPHLYQPPLSTWSVCPVDSVSFSLYLPIHPHLYQPPPNTWLVMPCQ